ncbi:MULTISPECIES: hypothetical protein [Streptomyces]|uniref:hypothetical protein n=1 Tax=Streptomyces TaxID=1883 RepID=UPI0004CD533D|nr:MULTISPECIES: hypothetical protein [Streptomyces]
MNTRHLSTIAPYMFAIGLTAGIYGLLVDLDEAVQVGVILSIAAVPLLVIRAIRATHHATADQLAQAEREGYRMALDHVARGLLDQHTPPNPGRGLAVEQVAGDVIHIRPVAPNTWEEKKAQ